jgi:hypothetical protein
MKGGEKGETEQMLCVYETALIVKAVEDGYVSDQTIIADTGASSHMVYSKRYLTIIQEVHTKVTAGNNMTMQCTLKGDYVGYLQSEGRKVRVNLKDVLYVPGLNVNLLSITQCLRFPGVTFGGDSDGLGLSFGAKHSKFDKMRNCMQQTSNQSSTNIL